MSTQSPVDTTAQPRKAPRLQRSAAAVIAQYIQDLTHPHEQVPCADAL
jgi:hypothetical protein